MVSGGWLRRNITRRSHTKCCADMSDRLHHDCSMHPDPFDCPDAVVVRSGPGKYGIPVHDGGSSYISIQFCPWCGKRIGSGRGSFRLLSES